MIEPTERTLWLVVLIVAVGALGLGVPALGDLAPFVAAGVVLAVIADVLLAGSPRRVAVRRVMPDTVVQGRPVTIGLELRASRACILDVVDSLPREAVASHLVVHLGVALAAGETIVLNEEVTFMRRGTHRLGRVAVRARGPLGLVRRRKRFVLDDSVDVIPDLARLAARAERLVRGVDEGGRRRRVFMDGRELDALREYHKGDDPRLVEWKVSARRSTLVVRTMRPESRQDLIIVVDAGRHLYGTHAPADGGEPRMDVAVTTTLILAAAALGRGDRVGVLLGAGEVAAFERPAAGRAQLRRIAHTLHGLEARAEESDYGAFAGVLLARLKRRAMVVVITDVLDEPSVRALGAAVGRIRSQHLPVVVALADPSLHRLAHEQQQSSASVDALVPLAATRILDHRHKGLAAVRAMGAVVVDAPAPRAAAVAVETYAGLKARGRL